MKSTIHLKYSMKGFDLNRY